jgi:hypothetical protein
MPSRTEKTTALFPFDPLEPLERQIKTGLYAVFCGHYGTLPRHTAELVKGEIIRALQELAACDFVLQTYPEPQEALPKGYKFISSLRGKLVNIRVDKVGVHSTLHELPEIEREAYCNHVHACANEDLKEELRRWCVRNQDWTEVIVMDVSRGIVELLIAAEAAYGKLIDGWPAMMKYFGCLSRMWKQIPAEMLLDASKGAYSRWLDESWILDNGKEEEDVRETDEDDAEGKFEDAEQGLEVEDDDKAAGTQSKE